MASNRVNVGSFVNPLESLQKSVSDLSTGYTRQVEADKERLRLNKAAEESKRRYEADKAYRLDRDATLDARAAEQKAFEEKKYADLLKRQEEQDRIATEKRALEEKQRQALINYAASYTTGDARRAVLEANPELQATVDAQIAANQDTLVQDALKAATLDGQTEQSRMLQEQNLFDDGEAFAGPNLGITEDMYPLEGAAAALERARAEGIDSVLYAPYDKANTELQSTLDNYIASNVPVYRGQEKARITQELIAAGADPIRAAALATDLSGQFSTVDELTKQAVARQKAEDARAKTASDLAYKALSLASKDGKLPGGSSNTSGKIPKGDLTNEDVMSYIEKEINAGYFDNQDLFDYWKAATAAGVDDKVAQYALKDFVGRDIFNNKYETGDLEDFIRHAKGISAANSGKSYEEYLKLLTPETSPYVDPIKANEEAFIRSFLDLRPRSRGVPLEPFAAANTDAPAATNPPPTAADALAVNEGPDKLRRDPNTGRVMRPISGLWNSSSINPDARSEIDRALRFNARNAELKAIDEQRRIERALAKANRPSNGERIDIYENVDIPATLREGLQAVTPFTPRNFSAGDLNLNPQEERTMIFLSNRSNDFLEEMAKRPNLTAAERKLIPIILQSRR